MLISRWLCSQPLAPIPRFLSENPTPQITTKGSIDLVSQAPVGGIKWILVWVLKEHVIKLIIYVLSHYPGWAGVGPHVYHRLGPQPTSQPPSHLLGVWELLAQNVCVYPLSERWSVLARLRKGDCRKCIQTILEGGCLSRLRGNLPS